MCSAIFSEKILCRFLVFIGVSVCFCMMYVIAHESKISTEGFEVKSAERHIEKANIYPVDFQMKHNDTFVLGFISLKNEEFYVVFEEAEDGGLSYKKYPAIDSTLYLSLDNEQSYVEKEKNGFGKVLSYKIYLPKNNVEIQAEDRVGNKLDIIKAEPQKEK